MSVASLRSDADVAALEVDPRRRRRRPVDSSPPTGARAQPMSARPTAGASGSRGAGSGLEAVLVNTGGGLAGGDQVHLTARLAADAGATITSATAERVYRALSGPTRFDIDVTLGPRRQARAAAAGDDPVRRRAAAAAYRRDHGSDASLTVADILVLGRRGMPETMTAGAIDDQLAHPPRRASRASPKRCGSAATSRTPCSAPPSPAAAPVAATLLHVCARCSRPAHSRARRHGADARMSRRPQALGRQAGRARARPTQRPCPRADRRRRACSDRRRDAAGVVDLTAAMRAGQEPHTTNVRTRRAPP